MIPHQLTMKAFGPYREETTVDFDRMGTGLYLITGDTGAGKTTIFDALVYALYGSASGTGRGSMDTESFHSDFAREGKRKEEMLVRLRFSVGRRTLTVTRTMRWGKKGEAQRSTREALLEEDGVPALRASGAETNVKKDGEHNEVTAKITELLGLNARQFRQIVMLAQGEFRQFLDAGSARRGEILGRLFDNRRHLDMEYRLAAASDALKERQKAIIADLSAQLSQLEVPEELPEELKSTLAPEHPALLEGLETLLTRQKEACAALEQAVAARQAELDDCKKRETLGAEQNRKLERRDAQRARQAELDRQRPRLEQLREAAEATRRALRVLPGEEQYNAEGRQLTEEQRAQTSRLERKAQAEARIRVLEAETERCGKELAPRLEALGREISGLEALLPAYDSLAESRAALEKAVKAEQKEQKAEQKLLREQKEAEASAARQTAGLARLEGAGEAAVQLAREAEEQVLRRGKELRALRDDVNAALREETKIKRLSKDYLAAMNAAQDALDAHNRLHQSFLDGQAGLLARELLGRLKREGTARCPVCGAVHRRGDTHSFAAAQEETPTRETVDAAKALSDAQQETARRQERKLQSARAAQQSTQAALLERGAALFPEGTGWEALAASPLVQDALDECRTLYRERHAALEQAQRDWDARQEAQRTLDECRRASERLRLAARETAERRQQAALERSRAAAQAEHWQKALQGQPERKEDALRRKTALLTEQKTLERQQREATDALEKSRRSLAALTGEIAAGEHALAVRQTRLAEAEERFRTQRERQGFASEEAYRAALAPEGTSLSHGALERWLAQRQRELQDYDTGVRECTALLRQLEADAAGLEKLDLTGLRGRRNALEAELTREKNEQQKLLVALAANRRVFARAQAGRARERTIARALDTVKPLADTANGRFSFDRYVLADFFRQVVEQANAHLDLMSDGEYSLVPTSSGDGRRAAGLELVVLDSFTGRERSTQSLSGGESFLVSLALALGLSDVVQQRNTGGVRIDSMFIDEGFGSLDEYTLRKALQVLEGLADGRRQVGIISHVEQLDNCLEQKIRVKRGRHGSSVAMETEE